MINVIGKYKYDFEIPSNVKDILNLLHTKYEAYIVGGCVRDLVLNKIPKDYDITTNATPEEIKELFKNYELINNNGEKHGTITVRYNKENYEITTYRIDGKYSDKRHPDNVEFTTDLSKDLSRRDFTINALVYDGKYVLDYFGGIEDLNNKIVKAVGDPHKRFEEDALRILRMIRFASVLNFDIDINTLLAGNDLIGNLRDIAEERITAESNKLVCGEGFARLLMNSFVKNILSAAIGIFSSSTYFLGHFYSKIIEIFSNPLVKDRDYLLSYSLFCPRVDMRNALYEKLIFSNKDKEILRDINITVQEKLKYINDNYLYSYNYKKCLKRSLRDIYNNQDKEYCDYIINQSLVYCLVAGLISKQDFDEFKKAYNEILTNNECYSLKQMEINGEDVLNAGIEPGPVVSRILVNYLNEIIDGTLPNDKEVLMAKLKSDIMNKIK